MLGSDTIVVRTRRMHRVLRTSDLRKRIKLNGEDMRNSDEWWSYGNWWNDDDFYNYYRTGHQLLL